MKNIVSIIDIRDVTEINSIIHIMLSIPKGEAFNVLMSAAVFPGIVIRNSVYQHRHTLITPIRTSDGSITGAPL
jgi:hypothetical protein